ncbi:hypothetical protein CRENBAI_008050 [Crenichthys baileyi]|uniref:Uncharacterized protein n=1 Tax=Crenichthys baileyi TaxID=28760 RepID=A0AAV9SLM2_9TELE
MLVPTPRQCGVAEGSDTAESAELEHPISKRGQLVSGCYKRHNAELTTLHELTAEEETFPSSGGLHVLSGLKRYLGRFRMKHFTLLLSLMPFFSGRSQDPVSSAVSMFNIPSSHYCTVTCSTEDLNINSTLRCDNKTCHQEGEERPGVTNAGSFLRIYLSDSSIICNHSNQVSSTQRNLTLQSCFRSEGKTD